VSKMRQLADVGVSPRRRGVFCQSQCSCELSEGETMNQALQDILAERARQDAKWGKQNHDPFTYLAVLTEEVGELAQAALHTRFGGPKATGLREEAIHTAAVALAIVECLDRGLWSWPERSL
jgi:NTP pyrophosphatase (non-canonical NTP hydrolase)